MQKNKKAALELTQAAMIAAVYAAVTLALPFISFGPVQFRLSEALTIMPILTPAGVPGVALGCLLANGLGVALGQTLPIDLLFGTAATLLAAIVSRLLRNKAVVGGVPILSMLSPVIFNALIVGAELTLFFGVGTFAYCSVAVGLGELAVVGIAGTVLLLVLRRTPMYKEN